MVMTSQAGQQPCVQSPPRTFVLPPWFFWHNPLSNLSVLLLTLVLILGLATASKLVESADTVFKNTTLPYPYLFTTNMPPSDSSSKAQPRHLAQTQTKTPLSNARHSVPSPSSYLTNSESAVFFEDPRRQKQFTSKAEDVSSVTNPSVERRISSEFSDVFVKAKYATPQPTVTKSVNYSPMQENATVPAHLNNITVKVPKFLNDHTSLPLESVLMPGDDSSMFVPSGMSKTKAPYYLHSESPADEDPFTYPYTTQSSESEKLNPCHLSEDALCRNSEERDTEVAASDSSSLTDARTTNLASSGITGSQSEESIEHSTSVASVGTSKLFNIENITFSKISTMTGSTLPSSSLVLTEPTRQSETTFSENARVNSVNVFEWPFGKLSLSEDDIYAIYDHRNSAESKPRTLTEEQSPDVLRTKKSNTAGVSSALSKRPVRPANGSSDHLERITVLGLFEMTTRAGERAEGRSELAAARLAVRHINERHLIPGYQLELITNDTKVTSII